jgi:NAD(P)H-dependent FMN reductase
LVGSAQTRAVKRSYARNYLNKARQFSAAMHAALDVGDWDAAGLNAVHRGLSANDALLVATHGVRSSSPRHADSIRLLDSLVDAKGVKAASVQLQKLISKKNIIEYEERLFKEAEAKETVKNADRFLAWVTKTLPLELQ